MVFWKRTICGWFKINEIIGCAIEIPADFFQHGEVHLAYSIVRHPCGHVPGVTQRKKVRKRTGNSFHFKNTGEIKIQHNYNFRNTLTKCMPEFNKKRKKVA